MILLWPFVYELAGLLKELQIYISSLQADALPVPFKTGMSQKKKWRLSVKEAGEAEWMIVEGGEIRGPLAANIILWIAETGQIDWETSYVWKRGMKEWLQIGKVSFCRVGREAHSWTRNIESS
ncbi:GYF domain-containing protein [Brevibacillus borstelensis]|jgi:GYF domain 2|uniref:GYF domain-containing protein n=1 Tax=Brevibacillus borstelensis AK1 TaxID=1300222 RepID=M8D186_9BACL|nr:GYF domain-containing protein [Brevibacillus borstelensis]EMT49979.1 hypothetical protein I532_24919 [Brevibacillus borstelensis AK1]KKX52882.1 hypothetical protein X546_22225 [Brevibacillus borstelensis cifa_chp40]MBE5393879.1 DUF4339 domain-containing protein [Brevibacillus borstelensis]MCM3560719.1 DUF4339 domain-containing protein [Brevibacillus borstelensis]MCM3593040.1 DUF4339 domain-containing protein [Brevibacillus borstelensis]